MPKSGPFAERPYLADANYHRLGYQLTAQLMHRESAGQRKRPIIEEAFEILYGSRARQVPHRDDPQREARRFAADAETVIEHYQQKRNRKTWLVRPGKLDPKEERLEEFLCRTVLPCLQIVIAASLRPTDPGAEALVAPLRKRATIVADPKDRQLHLQAISYRTLYNLACYEAAGEGGNEEVALSYLAAALERAPGARRRELGKWASKDPSLASLEDSQAFKDLLEPFE